MKNAFIFCLLYLSKIKNCHCASLPLFLPPSLCLLVRVHVSVRAPVLCVVFIFSCKSSRRIFDFKCACSLMSLNVLVISLPL